MEAKIGNITVPTTAPEERNQLDISTSPAILEKEIEHSKVETVEAENGDNPGSGEVEEAQYLTGVALVMMTFALMAGIFMIALDNSIISTAIPKITSDFHSLDDVGWYGTAYLLTQMSLQPTFGKLYSLFNIKWMYVSALMVFEFGSIICAVAPNSIALITGRAVAGIGASGIVCGALIIVGHTVTLRKRPLYIAVISSMYAVASVSGPLLGGLMTDSKRLTWRFCFWINLPFGALACLIIIRILKPPSAKSDATFLKRLAQLDFVGAVLLISSITCLVLALQWGGIEYSWSHSKVWGCLLGFGLLISIFICLQFRNRKNAMIPTHIISQRSVACCCIYKVLMQAAQMVLAFYVPFYFQAVKGVSAEQSGLRTLAMGITIALATLASGSLMTFLGVYVPFMWLGSAVLAVGSGLLYTLKVESNIQEWLSYQIVAGIGYGCAVQVPFFAIQLVLSSDDIAIGTSLLIFFQCLGGSLGLSIGQNILSKSLLQQLSQYPQIDADSIIALGGTGLPSAVPPPLLRVVLEAYNHAITTTFILSIGAAAVAFLSSLGMEWKQMEPKKKSQGGSVPPNEP